MYSLPQSSLGRQILWLISAMILCILVPLLLHDVTGGWANARDPYWSLAVIIVSGGCYAGVIAGGRRQLFGMVLWLFTYLFMGLAPYAQYRLDSPPGTTPDVDESLYPAAAALVIFSSLAAVAGMHFANRLPIARTAQVTLVNPQRAHILSAAAIAIFFYYGNKVGFTAFLLSRTEISLIRDAVWPNPAIASLLTGGLNMGLLVAFIAQMTVRQQRKVAGLRPHLLPALITGALLLYAVNPISGARYLVGTVYLAMLACFGAYATVRRFRIMTVAALVGLLTVFPLADTFRRSTDVDVKLEGPVQAMLSGDFDAFSQLANALSYVDAEGVTWGWQLLGVLLFWVPRAIWPGKPVDTGILLAEYRGYEFTNLSAPIWAEFLVNFGAIGVIVGMGVLGYWFRKMDRRSDLYFQVSPIPPVLVCAATFYLLIVLRGSLLNASSYLLVIVLASWFVTQKDRSTSRTRTTKLVRSPQSSPQTDGALLHR